jgi:hypothetical protein
LLNSMSFHDKSSEETSDRTNVPQIIKDVSDNL